MTNRTALSALVAMLMFAISSPGEAQQVDIIRGKVTSTDTVPLPNAVVTATTLSGNVSRTQRTDKNGKYMISFPGGEGDYWVTFSAVGFSPRRYQVKRTADQEILIADARLAPATVTLEQITVSSRPAVNRSDTVGDVSGNEKAVTADPGFLSVDQLGDLAAMAASIPGVQLLPGADGAADAFSVFGLGGDQNNTQLNGLAFGDASVPRDAAVTTSLSTSPYDVSRGGFSGGQLQIRTTPGSNFYRRNLSFVGVAPQLQWVDPAAAATGQQYTNLSVGGAASGPIKQDQAFYNTSFQFGRRMNDLQTLLNSSPLGFTTAGVAPDSVSRLLDILGSSNVPFNVSGFPSNNIQTTGSALGSFDWVQPNSIRGNTFTATLSGNMSLNSPVGSAFGGGGGAQAALSTPSREGKTKRFGGGAQLRHSGLLGYAGIFTETNLGYSLSRNETTPYYYLPAGTVRINSVLSDGSQAVRSLGFGGAPSLNTSSSNTTLSAMNTLSLFSSDNRHRVKLTSEIRREGYSQDLTSNQFGTFTFNSLEDLQNGRPASYTRQLSPRRREGSQLIGALSLGDAWRPTNDLQIQYGLRWDANHFLTGPAENPEVQQLFGRNNADVPSRSYFSPRIGFSWTYGTAEQVALIPGMVRAPRAVVRGGIGVFQNTPGTQLIGGAVDNTGLPTGLQQLNCLGDAAPSPDWSTYIVDQRAIPSVCANGTSGTIFASSAPNVTLFDPDYLAQRSIRGNLQWSGAILRNRFAATIDGTYSVNQHQSATTDLNFPDVAQFNLATEANRPVFAPDSAINAPTGQIAWRTARLYPQYGRVSQQTSDLSSESRQLTISLRPVSFSSRWGWSLSYVLADVREQYLGFQSTVDNPAATNWSRGSFSRHQFQYSLNYNLFNALSIRWSGGLVSGTAYTPLVSGDVNGDSYGNDRAFIFDPTLPGTDSAVAQGIQNLLTNGTRETISCLQKQLGRLADRNSCTRPWSMSGNLTLSLNSVRLGLPQRATISLQIVNPLGGLDRLVNGDDIKGWGQRINPDQQLLFVRGFDPVAKQFKYEVNQRFGSTRPSQTSVRQPTSLNLSVRYDIGPTRERQQLIQQLDRGRTRPGNKPNVQQLRGTASVGIINPMQQILQQSDSLKLTRRQADSLTVLNRLYILKSDSIWNPVARLLAELPDRYSHDLAYDRYLDARQQSVDVLIQIVPGIRKLLTPAQFRMLPAQLASFLDKRTLQGIRSGTAGSGGGGGGFGGGGGGGRRG